MGSILDCTFGGWTPGIGDRGAVAWVTVAAYIVAAAIASCAAGRAQGGERLFWALSGFCLVVLAVNKQLDLQTLMTVAGRCAARLQGWYDLRRTVQLAVILGLVLGSVAAGFVLLWLMRRTLRRTGLALFGLVWIASYVLVRAVGFHHVDRMLGFELIGPLRLNWTAELGGITLFALGAALAARAQRPTAT